MTLSNRFTKQSGRILVTIALIAASASAQFGPASAQQPQAVRANPLPLSGRMQTGSVTAAATPIAGTTSSVNTINPTIQAQGQYAGSADSTARQPFSGSLSLREAVQRAIDYNLGAVGMRQSLRQSRSQMQIARSALLPQVSGAVAESVQKLNLAATGLRFNAPVPGFSLPEVVGPFSFFDVRASLSHSIVNLTALNNYRSAAEILRATELSLEDARDLVVLAAGGAYLQVIAANARVKSARAQIDTANELYRQTVERRNAGLVAQIDVNHSEIQLLAQRQRLLSLENDLAKQKINLARLTGLPANDHYSLSDDVPFAPAPALSIEEALRRAVEQRADLKAAEAQIRAAERARSAARAQRLPTFSVSADYGALGATPSRARDTYSVTGRIHLPIFQGGRIQGEVEQAEAALAYRRAEFEDLQNRVESDIRNAYLDLEAAGGQVELSQKNLEVARDNLNLTRQRYDEGITDNLEVTRAQEAVARGELDYINGVFAHNVAKLSLARALGRSADNLAAFLNLR